MIEDPKRDLSKLSPWMQKFVPNPRIHVEKMSREEQRCHLIFLVNCRFHDASRDFIESSSNRVRLVNLSYHSGYAAIFAAVQNNDLRMVELLCESGANLTVEFLGVSPLLYARRQEYTKLVTFMEPKFAQEVEKIKKLLLDVLFCTDVIPAIVEYIYFDISGTKKRKRA